jgi:hypothetical protein
MQNDKFIHYLLGAVKNAHFRVNARARRELIYEFFVLHIFGNDNDNVVRNFQSLQMMLPHSASIRVWKVKIFRSLFSILFAPPYRLPFFFCRPFLLRQQAIIRDILWNYIQKVSQESMSFTGHPLPSREQRRVIRACFFDRSIRIIPEFATIINFVRRYQHQDVSPEDPLLAVWLYKVAPACCYTSVRYGYNGFYRCHFCSRPASNTASLVRHYKVSVLGLTFKEK